MRYLDSSNNFISQENKKVHYKGKTPRIDISMLHQKTATDLGLQHDHGKHKICMDIEQSHPTTEIIGTRDKMHLEYPYLHDPFFRSEARFFTMLQQQQQQCTSDRSIASAVPARDRLVEPLGDVSTLFEDIRGLTKRPATAIQKKPTPRVKRQRLQASPNSVRGYCYHQQQWKKQLKGLLNFKDERGHCSVPYAYDGNPTLARWVKRQRYQYKLKQQGKISTITDERIQELESVGFVWDSHSAVWQERYKELKEYSAKHGNCDVPTHFPPNLELGTWVKCQRRQMKLFWNGENSYMTLERIDALHALGFKWELRGGEVSDTAGASSTPTTTTRNPNLRIQRKVTRLVETTGDR